MNTVNKKTNPAESMSKLKISTYVFFGIILPVVALTANHILDLLSKGLGFNMLYTVGAYFFLPRLNYLYVTIGSGIVTLFLWIFFFRTHGKHYNPFIGGILLFNAFFYLLFGIAGIYRLLIIPVWLPPFCAAPILFLSSVRALRIARSVMHTRYVILTFLAGLLFVPILSLSSVRQPWELVKHLPNAKGANLSGMDLRYIFMEGGTGVTFEEADLSHADLRYASLHHCNINMQKVNLQGADMSFSSLSNLNLTEANMRDVNLNNATIYEVDFTGTDFRGASLGFYAGSRISMENTNLCGADLRNIEHIDGVYYWEGAVYDSTTLWPEGSELPKEDMVLISN